MADQSPDSLTGDKSYLLPERPCLRPLEAYMVDNPQRDPTAPKLLQLHDPSGLAPAPVALPPIGAAVVQLCDGTLKRTEIAGEFQKRYGQAISQAAVDGLLRKLDEAYMLDSPRFREHAQEVLSEFARAGIRHPHHAGRTYPSDRDALRAQLDGLFEPPNGPGLPTVDSHRAEDAPAAPKALIVPHTEFSRGGPAYAWGYRALLRARELPSLIVVLGTDHAALDPTFTLTRKHFDTPLGLVETDQALVDQLLEDARGVSAELPDRLLRDEHHHRAEHALEYQMVWLRHVLERRRDPPAGHTRPPKVLPILCGSLECYVDGSYGTGQADPAAGAMPESMFGPFLKVLRDRIAARQQDGQGTLWICSAELAHVGPRFGDRDPLSGADHDSLERRDKETLRPVCAGDADGWLQELRRERGARRVTGLSAIYTLLKAAAPLADGQLRCYAQCQAEAGSAVSIATIVF